MNAQPNLKIETWPIEKVINYARNARLHSESQVLQIAASIKEFGFINPCLVDPDGTLIAGHGRVMACKSLGMPTVPVIKIGHLNENQIKALRIADNQLPTLASWSPDLLRIELNDLQLSGYDMPLLGFDNVQLVQFLANAPSAGLTDPDEAPEPPANPVSIRGDLWALGRHRLLCGDAADEGCVAKALNGVKPNMCLTDPPYGIGETYDDFKDTGANLKDLIGKFLPIALSLCRTVLLTPGVANIHEYPKPTWILSWATPAGSGSGPWGFCCWQPVLAYGKDPYLKNRMGRRPDSLVKTEAAPNKTGHPCAKPVETWRWFMDRIDPSGIGVFYEPFSGSGTTIITGEMTGRSVHAIELSPAYIDVAIQRWQNFTGQNATLDGRTFAQISDERLNTNPKPKRKAKAS